MGQVSPVFSGDELPLIGVRDSAGQSRCRRKDQRFFDSPRIGEGLPASIEKLLLGDEELALVHGHLVVVSSLRGPNTSTRSCRSRPVVKAEASNETLELVAPSGAASVSTQSEPTSHSMGVLRGVDRGSVDRDDDCLRGVIVLASMRFFRRHGADGVRDDDGKTPGCPEAGSSVGSSAGCASALVGGHALTVSAVVRRIRVGDIVESVPPVAGLPVDVLLFEERLIEVPRRSDVVSPDALRRLHVVAPQRLGVVVIRHLGAVFGADRISFMGVGGGRIVRTPVPGIGDVGEVPLLEGVGRDSSWTW